MFSDSSSEPNKYSGGGGGGGYRERVTSFEFLPTSSTDGIPLCMIKAMQANIA